ncbi:11164_t:CDS:1, partial [Ambispora leptoticha]
VQRNGNYPLISIYKGELVNIFPIRNFLTHSISNIQVIQDSVIENKDYYTIESNNEEHNTYEANLTYILGILDK